MGQCDQAPENQWAETCETKEDAWFPVCLQGCCQINDTGDC